MRIFSILIGSIILMFLFEVPFLIFILSINQPKLAFFPSLRKLIMLITLRFWILLV